MKIARAFKSGQDLWPRISLLVTISFLALSGILWILGNQLLEDSRGHILEQRLHIAQLVANQIDHSLLTIVDEVGRTLYAADFDAADADLAAESAALAELYKHTGFSVQQVIFFDNQGHVVSSHPPNSYTSSTNALSPQDVANASDGRDVFFSTPWQESIDDNLVTAITVPIYEGGLVVGWLRCVVDLDESAIHAMLLDAVTQDETAHAILVDDQGRSIISTFNLQFLSPGEHFTFYRQAMAQNQAIIEEVPFELDLPDEPPGHHHIMAFVPLRTAPWGVSVGGDVIEETFAAPYRLFLVLAAFFIAALIATWGGTLLSTKRLLEPAQRTNLKFNISRQIANAKSWDELVSLIVRVPSIFMPVSDTRLLMPDDHTAIKIVSEWRSNKSSQPCPSLTQTAQVCETCSLARKSMSMSLSPCWHGIQAQPSSQANSYCFPLIHQNSLVGTLHFCIPSDVSISDNQIEILTSVSADMAIALESAQLQLLSLKHANITQAQQKRIFRALHDTIGQNISYLHLKLDQYSTADVQVGIPEIQRDIERMRDIANQAYQQMRNMLTELNPETQSDLVTALRSRSNAVAERANFNSKLTVEGKPANVSQEIKRHVLFMMSEALNNVEQHADARNVEIRLLWGERDLTISLADDGIGFDMDTISSDEHFGLSIMEDRAQAINAKLTVSSSPGNGTTVTLWIPL